MASRILSLSVADVHLLRDQMKALARDLKDTIKVDIEQATCAGIAEDVRLGIASIQDKDGNYLGADPAAVNVQVGLLGHDVIWRGQQIAYLEFGTGAAGASGGYFGSAMAEAGYSPDPTKTMWYYKDSASGESVLSHGLMPQAPMLNASIIMRSVSDLMPAQTILKEALQRAVTV